MAGLMDFLFNSDGPGGQPGAVGNTLNNGILNTVLGGVGKVIAPAGNAVAGGLGDFIADVTTKNPLEILKNPASALNDQGQVSLTRLLFPYFRREAVKADQQQAKLKDAYTQAQVINTYERVRNSPQIAPILEAMGLTPPQGAAAEGLQRQQDARNTLTLPEAQGGLALPAGVAQFVEPDQVPQAYFNAQRDKALAAERAVDNARAASGEYRAQTNFEERETPEKAAARKKAERDQRIADREAARAAQIQKEQAAEAASNAEADVRDTFSDRVKNAPDVPQAAIDKANNDINPFNNYGKGTQSKENVIKQRAEEIRKARAAAYAEIKKALPLTSRKNFGKRKEAKAVVDGVADAAKAAPVAAPAVVAITPEQRPQALAEAGAFIARESAKGTDTAAIINQLKAAGVPQDIIEEALR